MSRCGFITADCASVASNTVIVTCNDPASFLQGASSSDSITITAAGTGTSSDSITWVPQVIDYGQTYPYAMPPSIQIMPQEVLKICDKDGNVVKKYVNGIEVPTEEGEKVELSELIGLPQPEEEIKQEIKKRYRRLMIDWDDDEDED